MSSDSFDPHPRRRCLNDVPFDHDFSRAESVLKPLGATEGGGVAHSRWSDILVFGRQNYASGGGASPFVGVHCGSWEVLELDVESEVEVSFYNTDVDAFVASFLAFDQVVRGDRSTASLDATLEACDPSGWGRSVWRQLAEQLSDE